MNNNCWDSEKAFQRVFYAERYITCETGNSRYDDLARLSGGDGYYADHPDHVGDTVRDTLTCGKTAVAERPIDPNEFPTPAAAARRQ
jgi:thiamine pyrophosphate-dependent acetolactate synthase large subunit-like protein